MSFAELGLAHTLLAAISDQGYTEPTEIQAKAIPVILSGCDVTACAQTGTGKTAGFALPILQRLIPSANTSASPAKHPVRALILTPTRELAAQVYESFLLYGKNLPLRCTVVYGGVNIGPQQQILKDGVEILVATPGRLLDLVEQKNIHLGQVETLVLDEADRMLDMGFLPDIRKILSLLPSGRQSLLFSATFNDEITKLSNTLLNHPLRIEIAPRSATADLIEQSAWLVSSENKQNLLIALISKLNLQQVLIFAKTRQGANRLEGRLNRAQLPTQIIHGDKTQQARMEALELFKKGQSRILVATDIAARGLDIQELPCVINYELPSSAEDYVHRIGRTGRAGASGLAISLVAPEEAKLLDEIEKLIKRKIDKHNPDEILNTTMFETEKNLPRAGKRSEPEQDIKNPYLGKNYPAYMTCSDFQTDLEIPWLLQAQHSKVPEMKRTISTSVSTFRTSTKANNEIAALLRKPVKPYQTEQSNSSELIPG